jgi:Na+-transporting methylmalonyl-CoA/oxaloacetate decarboxylase beta subunit
MNKNSVFAAATAVMLALGIYMIYLGATAKIQPPVITGIGFLVIALVFWSQRNK